MAIGEHIENPTHINLKNTPSFFADTVYECTACDLSGIDASARGYYTSVYPEILMHYRIEHKSQAESWDYLINHTNGKTIDEPFMYRFKD